MKFLTILSVVAVSCFILLIVFLFNPFQTEVANLSIHEANLTAGNSAVANMDGYAEVVRAWPFFPIIIIICAVGYALHKVFKH